MIDSPNFLELTAMRSMRAATVSGSSQTVSRSCLAYTNSSFYIILYLFFRPLIWPLRHVPMDNIWRANNCRCNPYRKMSGISVWSTKKKTILRSIVPDPKLFLMDPAPRIRNPDYGWFVTLSGFPPPPLPPQRIRTSIRGFGWAFLNVCCRELGTFIIQSLAVSTIHTEHDMPALGDCINREKHRRSLKETNNQNLENISELLIKKSPCTDISADLVLSCLRSTNNCCNWLPGVVEYGAALSRPGWIRNL